MGGKNWVESSFYWTAAKITDRAFLLTQFKETNTCQLDKPKSFQLNLQSRQSIIWDTHGSFVKLSQTNPFTCVFELCILLHIFAKVVLSLLTCYFWAILVAFHAACIICTSVALP